MNSIVMAILMPLLALDLARGELQRITTTIASPGVFISTVDSTPGAASAAVVDTLSELSDDESSPAQHRHLKMYDSLELSLMFDPRKREKIPFGANLVSQGESHNLYPVNAENGANVGQSGNDHLHVSTSPSESKYDLIENSHLQYGLQKESSSACLFIQDAVSSPAVVTSLTLRGVEALAMIVWKNLPKTHCQIAILSYNSSHPIIYKLVRMGYSTGKPMMIIDLSRIVGTQQDKLHQGFFSHYKMTCRVLIIDVITHADSSLFSLLESSNLWNYPDTQVVFLGAKWNPSFLLYKKALRHVTEPIYIRIMDVDARGSKASAQVYSRCLYCNQGRPKITFVSRFILEPRMAKDIFPHPYRMDTFYGNVLRITTWSYYPYVQSKRDPAQRGTKVIPQDSMDTRIFETLAQYLNLTFEIHDPRDNTPGLMQPNGTWTGMIKDLIEGYVDATSTLTYSHENYKVMHLAFTTETDMFAIVTLTPRVLPRYLVIIKPFTVGVWMCTLLTIMVWGLSYWTLQKLWSYISGIKSISLNGAFFYSWAVILEDPPPRPPTNSSGQMLYGWWLIACLLITTGFRSALISHMTVESKSKPIDDFVDLLNRKNFHWGIEEFLLQAAPLFFFSYTQDPNVKKIYEKLEGVEIFESLERIKGGDFALIGSRNRLRSFIAFYQTDSYGQHPYYIGKKSYNIASDIGIGFRRGDPFGVRCGQLIQWLIEAGINYHWINDVIASDGRKIRMKRKQQALQQGNNTYVDLKILSEDTRVILRMSHMLGVFLAYFLGNIVALASFIAEKNINLWFSS